MFGLIVSLIKLFLRNMMGAQVLIKDPSGRFSRFPAKKNSVPGIGESVRVLPRDLGEGRFSSLDCRAGMDICLSQCRFFRDYQARIAWSSPMVTFVFCLAGQTRTRTPCRTDPIGIKAGEAYVHYFKDPTLIRTTRGKKEMNALAVRMCPDFMKDLINTSPDGNSRSGDRMNKALERHELLSTLSMTPEMHQMLNQMFNCPHQGLVRRIFLESKAMELVAALLVQVFETPGTGKYPRPLTPLEREKIRQARDILVSRRQFPPSLPVLAGMVDMSHARLTRGFKKEFGCTVFEYLRRERLAYSRTLLQENKMSVTQVAFSAGFSSSSHFAAAFSKAFGVTPSAFRSGTSSFRGDMTAKNIFLV